MVTKKEPTPLPLKVGYYELKRNIPNPSADRRKTNDPMRAETLVRGLRFRAVRNPDRNGLPGRDPEVAEVLKSVGLRWSHDISPWSDTAQWNALVGVIEPVPLDLEFLLAELGSARSAEYLLEELVDMGVVTLDHVRAAAQSLDEKWQKEEDELAAKEAAKP